MSLAWVLYLQTFIFDPREPSPFQFLKILESKQVKRELPLIPYRTKHVSSLSEPKFAAIYVAKPTLVSKRNTAPNRRTVYMENISRQLKHIFSGFWHGREVTSFVIKFNKSVDFLARRRFTRLVRQEGKLGKGSYFRCATKAFPREATGSFLCQLTNNIRLGESRDISAKIKNISKYYFLMNWGYFSSV